VWLHYDEVDRKTKKKALCLAWWVGFEPQTRRLKKTKTDVENRGAQTVWDLEKRLGTKDHQSGEETKKDGVLCHFSLLLADSFGGIIAHQFL
jgi:hypothetical protein